ncbi:hypothetical protein A2U01_0067252, partial [Trifolium medium]|nr:hypothetical protein [Trifolium medium]
SRHRRVSGDEVLTKPSCPTIPDSGKKQKCYEVKVTSEKEREASEPEEKRERTSKLPTSRGQTRTILSEETLP